MADEQERRKKCFVICRIGDESSDERVWSDDIYDNLIMPIADHFGFDTQRATEGTRPGEITARIVEDIHNVDLVVADLTFLNANVFYELALRHAVNMPFIHICRVGQRIPFDVFNLHVVWVDRRTIGGMKKTEDDLATHFRAVNSGEAVYENPVSCFHERLRVAREGTDLEKKISALEDKLSDASSWLRTIEREWNIEAFRRELAGLRLPVRNELLHYNFPLTDPRAGSNVLGNRGLEDAGQPVNELSRYNLLAAAATPEAQAPPKDDDKGSQRPVPAKKNNR